MRHPIRNWTLAITGLAVLTVTAVPASAGDYRHKGGYRGTAYITHKTIRTSPARHFRYRSLPHARATIHRHRSYHGQPSRRYYYPRTSGRRAYARHAYRWRHNDRLVAAGIVGAVVGLIVGRTLSNSMDHHDHVRVVHTFEHGRTGRPVTWSNPDTGSRYAVTPTRTYQTPSGRYCREYTTWGWVGGYEERLYGTVCRMPDGSWQKQG